MGLYGLLLLLMLLLAVPRLAFALVFQVEDVRIEGLQRVSAGTVFAALPVSPGELIDDQGIRTAVETLFRTGYFEDIRIERDGDVLVVRVVERPAVAEIKIDGNKAIETDQLLKALRDAGLAEGQIFRQAVLDGMSQELRRQYVAQGRYGASVAAEARVLPRNRVAIDIDIVEGKTAAIKHINIVGNRKYDNEQLRKLFELKTTGMLSWFSNDDKYSREKLSGDLERLESWYRDRGHLQFEVTSTQVSISPQKDAVYITVNIKEGDVFKVSDIELSGEPILPEAEIRNLIALRKGKTFSQILMTTSNELITKRLGVEGYTFAKVEGFPEVDEKSKTAKVTFFITPGDRAYVRRIEFRGNTKTADEVLRREMRQMEAASASTALIEHSKTRLERLGIFKTVEVETKEVPGTSDQVDVTYTVEEQPSGSIGASLGFAQGAGIILGANIQENNFLGSGNSVGFGVSTSEYRKLASFNFTDPYFTKDGISVGYSLAFTETDYGQFNLSSFSTDSITLNANFSYPYSDTGRIGFGAGVETLKLDPGFFTSLEILDFIVQNGDQYNMFSTNVQWSESTLNRGVLPTNGRSHRVSFELTVPSSDLEYYKLTYAANFYRPITGDLVLHLRSDIGYGGGFGGTERLPFFKNFFGGGFGSVRGIKRNTLGPQDSPLFPDIDDSDAFGGNVRVEGSAEVLFPFPFMRDRRNVQAAVFLDAGNIFDTDCGDQQTNCFTPDLAELRYSTGLSAIWLSGFGPIQVSFGSVLNADSDDETEFFQFSLGQTF
ncbi:MAG TPA: outer membrane protein assembly factor BamA [Porticoccaceae bacterium]|nr:outer membrane protein assembly factor BamA [Porticoccaceae bacterium]